MSSIHRGFEHRLEFDVQKADNTAQVISGTTAVWKIAASDKAVAALLTKSDLVFSTVSGKSIATLTLTAEETAMLAAGQYFHQLAVTLQGGQPQPYFKGWITVSDSL